MKHQNETTRVDHPEHPLNKRLKALEQAFDRRGLIPENYFAEFHKRATEEWKPENGAKVVARAWTDPKFRQRLLADGKAAVAEMGYSMPEQQRQLVAPEDTATVQNVIV